MLEQHYEMMKHDTTKHGRQWQDYMYKHGFLGALAVDHFLLYQTIESRTGNLSPQRHDARRVENDASKNLINMYTAFQFQV
jgi:hypothetical protein